MRMLLHRDTLTERYFYEKIFLHGDAFTHGSASTHTSFYTEISEMNLHRRTLRTQMPVQSTKEAFTRGVVTYGRFYTDILLHDTRWRTPILCERVQQAGAKREFHHSS